MASTRNRAKKSTEPWAPFLKALESLAHRVKKTPHDCVPDKILTAVYAVYVSLFGPEAGDEYWRATVLPNLQYLTALIAKEGPACLPQDARLLLTRAARLMEPRKVQFTDLKPARLQLPAFKELRLIQVGCGGTGSWLAPQVARVARKVQEDKGARVRVYFVDDDLVQAKNLRRQNFCEPELGVYKATALARRYSSAYGVEAVAVTARFSPEHFSQDSYTSERLTVVIGCVDTSEARAEINQLLPTYRAWHGGSTIFWLDCGNDLLTGQVYLGSASKPDGLQDAFPLPGYCRALPSPALQDPKLLMPQPEADAAAEPASCADLTTRDSQSQTINQAVAAIAASYLFRMFDGVLDQFATYLNLQTGATSSTPITPENVALASGALVSQLAPSLFEVLSPTASDSSD